MGKHLFVTIALLAACGGKKGGTTPPPTGGSDEPTGGPTNNNDPGSMVSAETMDEITKMFARKGTAVSHCLAIVVDNKELPKNSHGKVTLDVTISSSGKAESVKVLKATLESKALESCIIDRVKEIQFPTLPKPYPTTYTYAFEAM